jgi:hypothetical protein
MQDYEVRDVMNRRRDPKLEVMLNLKLLQDDWFLTVTATNVAPVIARHVQIVVDMPPVLNRRLISASDHGGSHIVRTDGLRSFQIRLHNNTDRPVFAGDTATWFVQMQQSAGIGLPPTWTDERPLKNFWYRVFADEMKMVEVELAPTEVVEILPPPPPSLSVGILTNQTDIQVSSG